MAGTKRGGRKAANTNRQRHGDDFYARIGSMGGRKTDVAKGFAAMSPEKRSAAGRKGGRRSSRAGVLNGQRKIKVYYDVNKNDGKVEVKHG